MNNDVEEMVKRLSFENLIWIGFIITSALNIYGDEMIKMQEKKQINFFLEYPFFLF